MHLSLSGQRALVCGASKGIGLATVRALAASGARVYPLARSADLLDRILSDLPKAQRGEAIAVDMRDHVKLAEKVGAVVAREGPFSILVNNSGGPPAGPIIKASAQEFLDAYSQHLLANAQLAQLVLPGMQSLSHGRIINIISTSVKVPITGLGVSNTTRGAVASWAKTLAEEVAPWGITVNNVLPGATMTERLAAIIANKANVSGKSEQAIEEEMRSEIPARRFARPDEIAQVVTFLASDAASYITGVSIPVDGGRTRCL